MNAQPQPALRDSGRYFCGDVLRHHSLPGVYRVIGHRPDRRVRIQSSVTGWRSSCRPDYLAENFTRAELPDGV